MNDKRESDKRELVGATPESVLPIIADLEAIDRKLAGRAAADSSIDLGAIEKARVRVREAIGALTPLAAEEAGEDPGSAKRRGKSKAEGGSGKSGARGGRKPAAEEKPQVPSLLARLGAVAQPAGEPVAEIKSEAAAPPDSAKSALPDKPRNTAERLAQLEAEIADLTEAVTASPAKSASANISGARAAPAKSASAPVLPAARPEALDLASDGDDDAEIVIVGAHGAPTTSKMRAGRNVPRILADTPSAPEEDAEVEIRGRDGTRAGRPAHAGDGGRRDEEAGKGPTGRWRLFRGSR